MDHPSIGLADHELVARIGEGETTAFEELVRRYESRLFNIALRFARNVSDAQDIVQLAFLSVWRHLHTFEGRAQVGSWIHRVATNTSLMFLRARERQPGLRREDRSGLTTESVLADLSHLPGLSHPVSPEERTGVLELERLAQMSVERLPIGLRQVFVKRVLDGYSTGKTASMLGISTPAVKARLYRARARLRRDMQIGLI
jgi:RNA polymerase sigma-70 factor (ECF subfamily)